LWYDELQENNALFEFEATDVFGFAERNGKKFEVEF
jgi:hypothetical protein